ncbi:MAG: hypothetical protein ACTSPV_12195 [Candidatus Hodarchaeales archaeon]
MTKRDIRKEIFRFLRSEIKTKKAEWGELRRVKGVINVEKGLPNVPNLILQVQPLISYFVIIMWTREIRIYLFDRNGSILGAESYFENTEQIYDFICSKSKKITRYPSIERKPTIKEVNIKLDQIFQEYWRKLANKLGIQTKIRKKRPLIAISDKERNFFLNTDCTEEYIMIEYPNRQLKIIYTFYCLFFFLPKPFQKNKKIAKAIALYLLLRTINEDKQTLEAIKDKRLIKNRFERWNKTLVRSIYKFLNRMSEYYDETWIERDFKALLEIPLTSKQFTIENFPDFFCKMYLATKSIHFWRLSEVLGIPVGKKCSGQEPQGDELSHLIIKLKKWEISEVRTYIRENEKNGSKGLVKGLKEGLQYCYTNAIEVELKNKSLSRYKLTNKTDLKIVIDQMICIFEDGSEKVLNVEEKTVKAKNSVDLHLEDVGSIENTVIRLVYHILEPQGGLFKPIFSGTIII